LLASTLAWDGVHIGPDMMRLLLSFPRLCPRNLKHFRFARAFSELTESFWDFHGIEFLIQGVGW
jgi:hypothetical protein